MQFKSIIFLLVGILLARCSDSSQSKSSEKMNRDVNALESFITLSPKPIHVRWEKITTNDHFGELAIVALMDYEAQDSAKLQSKLIPLDYSLSNVPEIVVRDWFEPQIRSQFASNPKPSKEFHLSQTGFEVQPFQKAAMSHGFCTWIGDKLLLYIYSV